MNIGDLFDKAVQKLLSYLPETPRNGIEKFGTFVIDTFIPFTADLVDMTVQKLVSYLPEKPRGWAEQLGTVYTAKVPKWLREFISFLPGLLIMVLLIILICELFASVITGILQLLVFIVAIVFALPAMVGTFVGYACGYVITWVAPEMSGKVLALMGLGTFTAEQVCAIVGFAIGLLVTVGMATYYAARKEDKTDDDDDDEDDADDTEKEPAPAPSPDPKPLPPAKGDA